MKVFLSWSGDPSKALAQILHEYLPLVLHYVQPWFSDTDIAAGERWFQSVEQELEASDFGIICVTRENVGSPWVLFEAGALAKSMQRSRVIPFLLDLDVSDITGPLAQFQAKKVGRLGLFDVIQSVKGAADQRVSGGAAEQGVSGDRVKTLFDALWPKVQKELESISQQPQTSKPTRPQHEILEELVVSVRNLESRLRDVGFRPKSNSLV